MAEYKRLVSLCWCAGMTPEEANDYLHYGDRDTLGLVREDFIMLDYILQVTAG